MAAGAWKFYNETKRHLGIGGFDFAGGIFYMMLVTPASNAATLTLSNKSEITNEIAAGNGYTANGKTLSAPLWITGASVGEYRFDATEVIWTATGGNLPASASNINFAVIYQSGGLLLCFSTLSTSNFNVTSGNTLTVTPNVSGGVFELNG